MSPPPGAPADAADFVGGQLPSGVVTLFFSEEAAVQLDVECVEAQMRDLGPVWEVESRPAHDEEATVADVVRRACQATRPSSESS